MFRGLGILCYSFKLSETVEETTFQIHHLGLQQVLPPTEKQSASHPESPTWPLSEEQFLACRLLFVYKKHSSTLGDSSGSPGSMPCTSIRRSMPLAYQHMPLSSRSNSQTSVDASGDSAESFRV